MMYYKTNALVTQLLSWKKTCCGLLVEDARRVIEMELVFDAKMQDLLAILSSWTNKFFFISSDSTIASTIKSASRRTSKFRVHCRRLKASVPNSCKKQNLKLYGHKYLNLKNVHFMKITKKKFSINLFSFVHKELNE